MTVEDFKNDAGLWVRSFTVEGQEYKTKASSLFSGMHSRCKIGGYMQRTNPAYVGCSCEFNDFQEFAEWCNLQVGYGLPDFQLDKDILKRGNKVYCKEHCCFVPQQLNKILNRTPTVRGKYALGVVRRPGRMFEAQVNLGNGSVHLGSFETEVKAFEAYKVAKKMHIQSQAEFYKGVIDERVYEALINWEINFND